MTGDRNAAIRLAAFDFLEKQCQLLGEVLPWQVIERGFEFEGRRINLVGQSGIWRPAVLTDGPISILTTPIPKSGDRPYEDEIGEDGTIVYRYRGKDPNHRDNLGLQAAMTGRLPLIYFFGLVTGKYLPIWPVFVINNDPSNLIAYVKADDQMAIAFKPSSDVSQTADLRRTYVTVQVQRRMHQQGFRLRVLQAYMNQCAICRLKHLELLDAAHILEDRHPQGIPAVSNGLSMCKLHHAAFDRSILGIRPDLQIEVRMDILREIDGPMLVHGIQGFHGKTINVPRDPDARPKLDHLEERYARFRQAG